MTSGSKDYLLRPAQASDAAAAEAKRAGYDSIYLYTHETMVENLAGYAKIGYVQYDRRVEAGLARVYMRKKLL